MTKQEIIDKVKALELPEGEYVVFGSCPLAAVGIREASDVDMLVSKQLFASLLQAGWEQVDKGGNDRPLARDVFDVDDNWDFSSYSPSLSTLLATADVYDGVPFASLSEVRKWKLASGRSKDLQDIALLDAFLAR